MDAKPSPSRARYALWYVAILVGGTVILAGLLEAGWGPLGDHRPLWARDLTYSLYVQGPPGTNYTVIAPVLVAPDGAPAPMLQGGRFFLDGVGTPSLIDSDYGRALAFVGRGRAEFWVTVPAAHGAAEPETYAARYPGGNYGLDLWTTANTTAEFSSIGSVWLRVEAPSSAGEFRVTMSIEYPFLCGSHYLNHLGTGASEWVEVNVEAQQGCPVA